MNTKHKIAISALCGALSLASLPLRAADDPAAEAARIRAESQRSEAEARKDMEQARKDMEQARQQMMQAAREMAEAARASGALSPKVHAYEFIGNPKRAVLGVIVDDDPWREGKTSGLYVHAVTPGGGAEAAGLKAGDVLVAINGRSLESARGERSPLDKLREVMEKLEAGDTVELRYTRDGKTAKASVTASRPDPLAFAPPAGIGDCEHHEFRLGDGDADVLMFAPPLPPAAPGAPQPPVPWFGTPGLELASLDENLAGYFKTRQGVLVVSVPDKNPVQLKSGDVIQSIDGNTVDDPREALRRLSDRNSDDLVKLGVLRMGKAVQLEGRLPERGALLAPLGPQRVRVIVNEEREAPPPPPPR